MKAATRLCLLALTATLALGGAARAQEACEGGQSPGEVKLIVQVASLRSAEGQVAVTIYPDNARRFLAPRGKLLRQRARAAAPVTHTCFWVMPGVYALAAYHDRNANRDFDRNAAGMPAEGYGFSNDAPTRFGLPAFDDTRFRVPAGGRTLRIQMRYPK